MPALSKLPVLEEIVAFVATAWNWCRHRPSLAQVELRRKRIEENYPDDALAARAGEAVVDPATVQRYATARAGLSDRLVQPSGDVAEDTQRLALVGIAIEETPVSTEADELRRSDWLKTHAVAIIRSDSFPIDVASFSERDLLREVEEYTVDDVAAALSLLLALLQCREHAGQPLHLVDRARLALERKDRTTLQVYLERYDRTVRLVKRRRNAALRQIHDDVRSAIEARLDPLADNVLADDPQAYCATVEHSEEQARRATAKKFLERHESFEIRKDEAARWARQGIAESWQGYDPTLDGLFVLLRRHRVSGKIPKLLDVVRRHVGMACGLQGHVDPDPRMQLPVATLVREDFWRDLAADVELRRQFLGDAAEPDAWPFRVDGDQPISAKLYALHEPRVTYTSAMMAVVQVLVSQHVYRCEAIRQHREIVRQRHEYSPGSTAWKAVKMVFSPVTRTIQAVSWH